MRAIRARHAYDGESFLGAGAMVLVQDGTISGVEPYNFQVPGDCPVTDYDAGTLLPGLIDTHTHLVADSAVGALDRVAGYSAAEIDEVISRALRDQLQAGVTTVRDLGDRNFCVLDRRDRQLSGPVTEPAIFASGPPLTSRDGHCHYLGGAVSGTTEIVAAVAERAERGADIIKVMASGGVNTPGSDVMRTQFSTADLQLIVDQAHAAGLAVTAHAHGTPAVEQAIAAGVDGIEHCSGVTDRGFGDVSDDTVAALARSGIVVCPTIGLDQAMMKSMSPPPHLKAALDRLGLTAQQMLQSRWEFVSRLHQAGVQPRRQRRPAARAGARAAWRPATTPTCSSLTATWKRTWARCTGPGQCCCAGSPSAGSRGQHGSDHPVTLRLELLVPHPVRPGCGADRLAHQGAVPRAGLARVGAVALQEGCLQAGAAQEVLAGQPGEVGQRGAHGGAAEVDDADDVVVDEPVPRLPVAVGRHQGRGRRRPAGDLGAQLRHRGRRDPVRSAEPRQGLLVLPPLVLLVGDGVLGVQQGKQPAGLAVSGGSAGVVAAEHQLAGQVPGDQDLRVRVAVDQRRRAAPAGPRQQPAPVGVQLAGDVVIIVAAGFGDEPVPGQRQLQDGRRHQAPAVLFLDAGARKPLSQQGPLPRGQIAEVAGHSPILRGAIAPGAGR